VRSEIAVFRKINIAIPAAPQFGSSDFLRERHNQTLGGTLPWPERAVYFLRGILHYSCEETGLLLNLSDVKIDQLYKFAAKSIGTKAK
jgi:hypothetical protein